MSCIPYFLYPLHCHLKCSALYKSWSALIDPFCCRQIMSTSEPPTKELQLENINIVLDAQVVDRSLSEVVLPFASPATEIVTSVTSASTETPVSSSQVIESGQSSPRDMDGNPNVAPYDLARPCLAHQSFSSGALTRQNMPFGGNQQSPSQMVSPYIFFKSHSLIL
jgi:hypothetical protein